MTWKIQKTIDEINDMKNKFTQENIRPFFPWRLHFGEIFKENGGFDIVIGNPPYVWEKWNKDIFQPIVKSSLWEFYQRRMDLFYFFFHLWLNIWKKWAQIGFITTNYYITATGGTKLREDLKARSTIINMINFWELKIFESALGQHNLITMLQKGETEEIAKTIITNQKGFLGDKVLRDIINGTDKNTEYYSITQNEIYDNGYIKLSRGRIDNILDEVKVQGEGLGGKFGICNVNQWIVSSADKISNKHLIKYPNENYKKGDGVFVLTNQELEEKNIKSKYTRAFYKNSDIYKYNTQSKNILNIFYFKDLKKTHKIDDKNLKNHFKRYKQLLIDRLTVCRKNKFQWNIVSKWLDRGDYFLLFYPRKEQQFNLHKIVVPYRSKTNTFGYNEIPWYAASDVFFITSKDDSQIELKYILALLNSKLYYKRLYYRGKRKWENLELKSLK